MQRTNRIKPKVLKKLKQEYDQIGTPCHGIIKVVKDNKYGFVDEEGRVLIPPMYDWGSSFCKIRLYGKVYIGAYVTEGGFQTIITPKNRKIIQPIESGKRYYIINEKLWVETEQGFNLISRRGKKLLATDYDVIVVDRLQQPKNIFLVKKNGHFGGIHIAYNNQEKTIVPFVFNGLSFWWTSVLGTFLEGKKQGRKGLYSLKGELVVPCKYTWFECNLNFRKGFILATNNKEAALYDGKHTMPICVDPYSVSSRYAFYYHDRSYYLISSTAEELLLDQDAQVIVRVNKDKHISYFHFMMNQQRDNFRFKSLGELIKHCKTNPQKRIGKKELVVYAYFFIEEELHKYALQYDLKYVRFSFLDWRKERDSYWGYCDILHREIALNIELLFTSEDFIRQVILHELCHFVHSSHKKEFYKMLNNLYGRDVRKEPKFNLNTRWFETVDTKVAVRYYTRKLFDLAEQGILQKSPKGVQISSSQVLSLLPERNLPSRFDNKIAALRAKGKNKPIP